MLIYEAAKNIQMSITIEYILTRIRDDIRPILQILVRRLVVQRELNV